MPVLSEDPDLDLQETKEATAMREMIEYKDVLFIYCFINLSFTVHQERADAS